MGKITWLLLAALCALASHISYVLFVPNAVLARSLTKNVKDFARNELRLLSPEAQAKLFPAYRGESVTAICAVDVRGTKIKLKAFVPNSYWTLAVHSEDGAQQYSINDAQAESDSIEITLSQARGYVEQVLGGSDGEDAGAIANVGWNIELPSRHGLAVLWIPLSDPLARKDVENLVGKSTCSRVNS